MATTYRCPAAASVHCEQGYGRAPRPKCRNCGSPFLVQVGVWGVFTWRGDGGYRLADAHKTFQWPGAADTYAATDESLVVRFISES